MIHGKTRQLLEWKYTYVYTSESSVSDFILCGVINTDDHNMNLMFVDPCITVQFIKKNPTRCNNVSTFYYSLSIWSSACFGQHTAHHQEHRTALSASSFSYVECCWTCSWWTLSGTAWQRPPTTRPNNLPRMKNQRLQCSFRLLMMGSVSLETCWASYK